MINNDEYVDVEELIEKELSPFKAMNEYIEDWDQPDSSSSSSSSPLLDDSGSYISEVQMSEDDLRDKEGGLEKSIFNRGDKDLKLYGGALIEQKDHKNIEGVIDSKSNEQARIENAPFSDVPKIKKVILQEPEIEDKEKKSQMLFNVVKNEVKVQKVVDEIRGSNIEIVKQDLQVKERQYQTLASEKSLALKKHLIHPGFTFWLLWEYLMTFVLIYISIFSTFKIGFIGKGTYPGWDYFEYFVDGIYLLDLILHFWLTYHDEDMVLVTERKKIIKRYLLGTFIVDLLSSLPYGLIDNIARFFIFLRFSKLTRLYQLAKLSEYFHKAELHNKSRWSYLAKFYTLALSNYKFTRVYMNMIFILLFNHVFACLWHLVAANSSDHNNWIINNGLSNSSIFERYITSLYWITQTVVSFDGGDNSWVR